MPPLRTSGDDVSSPQLTCVVGRSPSARTSNLIEAVGPSSSIEVISTVGEPSDVVSELPHATTTMASMEARSPAGIAAVWHSAAGRASSDGVGRHPVGSTGAVVTSMFTAVASVSMS
jgi:hypothetical protein